MTQELFFERTGRRGAPPLVLVHGFGATNHFWRKVIPDLSKDHDVHAVELMGIGRSPAPKDGDLSPLAQGRALAEHLRRLAEEHAVPPILIGHSLGGAVALIAVLEGLSQSPQIQTRGLVVISGAVFPQRFPPFITLARTPGIRHIFQLTPPPAWAFKAGFRGIIYDPRTVDQGALEGYRQPLGQKDRRRAIVQAARQLDPALGLTLQQRYRRITTPLLALWGEEDRVVPPRFALQLARTVPNGRATLLPEVGHLPPEEAPTRTLTEIRRFLAALPPVP